MARNVALRDEPGELAHYDPEKGLKAVAVAEAAEKHFARAKDLVQLFKAIEAKLKEQRKFVLWWDGGGFNKPGSPILSDRKGLKAGKGGLPTTKPTTGQDNATDTVDARPDR